jgi:hypothetical protein
MPCEAHKSLGLICRDRTVGSPSLGCTLSRRRGLCLSLGLTASNCQMPQTAAGIRALPLILLMPLARQSLFSWCVIMPAAL